jgi:hypothetical protein
MTPNPAFGFEQAATELIRGVVETVADLPGLTQERRFLKQQTTIFSVLGFLPRDPLEIMLAGQCIIYDAMLRDGARDLLHDQPEEIKLRTGPGNLASGRMFLTTLRTLRDIQNRDARVVPQASAIEPETPTVPAAAAASVAAPSPPPTPPFVREPRAEAAIPPRPDAAIRLPDNAPALLVEPATLRARLRGSVSNIALSVATPDQLARAAVANRNPKTAARAERNAVDPLGDLQAATVSTARTQRAMAPLAEIATGMSPTRHASTA